MTQDTPTSYLGYLHSFRGFAIINIAAIHAIALSNWGLSKPISIGNEVLFHNSTIYFALISGLLFTAVLKEKGYEKFYFGKFKNVVLPYLFFSLLFTVYIGRPGHWFETQPDLNAYLKDIPRNLVYGKASFAFWYIPVLFFLYLVTPLLDFIQQKKWIWAMMLIIATPLLVRRVELSELITGDFLPFQNMIYFTGAYAAGMFLASDLEVRMEWISKNKFYFLAIAVLASVALVYCKLQSFDRAGEFSLLSNLFYIQKMALGGLVLVLLKNLGDRQPVWLQPIAKSAFTIYFLHGFFIAFLLGWFGPVTIFQSIVKFNILLAGVIVLILCIALSMIVAWGARKVFGKYSRMVVGS